MSELTRALNLTRRDLLKGAAGGAAGLLVAGSAGKALASSAAKAAAKPLHGGGGDDPSYTLTAAPVDWNVGGGRLVSAWAFNGTVPGPTLYANAGDTLPSQWSTVCPNQPASTGTELSRYRTTRMASPM